MEIIHADALVHPDFHLKYSPNPCITKRDLERREAWEERANEIARNPRAILFYFSNFIEGSEPIQGNIKWTGEENLLLHEQDRIRRFEGLLGKRLILYPEDYCPTKDELLQDFWERNFTYNPHSMTLLLYGEYYDWCVMTRALILELNLGIPITNLQLSPLTSLLNSEVEAQERKPDYPERNSLSNILIQAKRQMTGFFSGVTIRG